MTETIRVDLHCHSSLSDGALSPEEVACRLSAGSIEWAALTDHNTVRGQERFRVALEDRGIGFVSGVEVDVESPEGPLHLLAYGCDLHDRMLRRMLHVVRHPLRSHARYWLDRAWSWNGRTSPDAGSGCKESPPALPGLPRVVDAINVIHEAGGLAFVAHPLTSLIGVERLEGLLAGLRGAGLDGLEAFYKPYTAGTQRILLEVAQRGGLLVSAGSDYHGADLPGEGSPGVEMPVVHWRHLRAALGLDPSTRETASGFAVARGSGPARGSVG